MLAAANGFRNRTWNNDRDAGVRHRDRGNGPKFLTDHASDQAGEVVGPEPAHPALEQRMGRALAELG
jgi:hypothetical protein